MLYREEGGERPTTRYLDRKLENFKPIRFLIAIAAMVQTDAPQVLIDGAHFPKEDGVVQLVGPPTPPAVRHSLCTRRRKEVEPNDVCD